MTPEERTPEAIRQALDDLVTSDGWRILRELVLEQYGPEAFERAVDDAIRGIAPSEIVDMERAVVPQIRAAFKAARLVLDLPTSKLRALESADRPAARLFDQFRRGPKRA